jgi:hypothetical protein
VSRGLGDVYKRQGYGSSRNETTDFINASFLDERYFNKHVAITYEIYGPNSDYIK